MAIITTPGAGVSPYQTTENAPTILRAGANGATVLANATVAKTTANIDANTSTNTDGNTSVYVAGQAALNSLITSNQPGTFQGANVNITLEEQNFNTTNQVTSTINYASGAAGSIQYNNGANGFAGSDYFTYTSGNVVTPGIRTDGYFYSNGAPFTSGGNAAIGNFVFNGDNMTIAHANSTLSVTGNGTGNVNISANSKTWTFGNNSNLTFPDNSGASWPINQQRFGMGNIGAWLDGQWTIGEFSGNGVSGTVGIRIDPAIEGNTGVTIPNQVDSTTQPVQIYNTGGGGISLYTGANNWAFNADGTTTFPTLTVDLHNGGTQTGQTLQLGDPGQQAFITGPTPSANVNAQRLIIQGQRGNGTGEGGDVYLWAGDANNNGGDIKIYAGDADAGNVGDLGGYVNIDGGRGYTRGGQVEITGGYSASGAGGYVNLVGGQGNNGGNVDLLAGYGQAGPGGFVIIQAGGSANGLAEYGNVSIAAGASTWSFNNNGTTQFPGNLLQPPEGNPLDIKVTVGNAYSTVSLYDTASQLIIQDNTTGPNPAWALFEADLANVNTPQAVVILKPGDTGNEVRWTFNADGGTIFPTLSTQRGDNPSGTISGQTLLFGNALQEAVISTPDGTVGNEYSQRLVINPGAGNNYGEGGDIYLWAGRGGDGSGTGGDIKIRGGQGGANTQGGVGGAGGYIRIEAGDAGGVYNGSTGPVAGFIEMTAGTGGENQPGGYVRILGGTGSDGNYPGLHGGGDANITGGTGRVNAPGGNVNLIGGISANGLADYGRVNISSGASTWIFDNAGNLVLPHGGIVNEGTAVVPGGSANTITLTPSGGGNADQQLLIYPTAGEGNHLHLTSGNLYNTELYLGSDDLYVKLGNNGNVYINANDSIGNTAQWSFGSDGNLITPGASGNISGANVIIANIISATGDVESANVNAATLSAIGNVIANNAVITNYITCAAIEAVGNIVGNTVYAGNSALSKGQVSLANVIFVGADAAAEYVQSAMINTGGNGSADWVSYANNGNNDQGWVDMGMTGNTFNDPNYQVTDPNDGYVLVQGTNTSGTPLGGNLVLATGNVGLAHDIVFATGGFTHADIKARIVDATGEFSVVGNVAANYFIGNGSQLTSVAVPSQTILPTIQLATIDNTSNTFTGSGGSGWANVTVANIIPVTEYGVIITDGTSSQKYATGALGSIPGTVQLNFSTAQNGTPFTVYAYVTSNAGTYYSSSATGTSGICLLAGTQIALSDGSRKAIEDITYTDKLLSWDFDRGCYAETTALWIKRSETGNQYNLLTFSDGTTLRTFDQHRIFNKQAGAFTYPMTESTPVGTITVNEHGQEITLTNKQVIKDIIEYYNVITDYHMNLFSDSVLTSCRFNNIYPITDMKFIKDSRTLRTRAEFENVEDRFFHGLRLAEQTTDIETVEWYVNRLLATEVSAQSELAF